MKLENKYISIYNLLQVCYNTVFTFEMMQKKQLNNKEL